MSSTPEVNFWVEVFILFDSQFGTFFTIFFFGTFFTIFFYGDSDFFSAKPPLRQSKALQRKNAGQKSVIKKNIKKYKALNPALFLWGL